MQERAAQGECLKGKVEDSTDEELENSKDKKYVNGKPKRELKKQITFEEAEKEPGEKFNGKKRSKIHS